MGVLRSKNMLRLFDYKSLIGFTILTILFLIYENSTHNVSLEDCEQCKGN